MPKCCDTHSSTHVTSPSRKSSNIPHLHPTMVLQIFVGTSGHVAAGTHVKPRDGSQVVVGETVSIRRAFAVGTERRVTFEEGVRRLICDPPSNQRT